MSLNDAEKEVNEQEYGDAVEDLEEEIESVERDFETVKDDEASGELKEKQERAENILGEIHEQLQVLQKHIDNASERNKNF